MKFKSLTGSALGLLAVGGLAWGCSGQSSDCSANESCGAYSGGSAGTTGTGGDSANAGNAGTPGGGSGGGGKSGASGGSGASGMSGAGEAGAAGSGGVVPCDTTKTPTAEACLVTDDYGIFVAPSGDDTNAGSMSAPVKTITKAIALAQNDGKFVVACDGTYDEQVNIVAGVELYGGFKCPGGTGEAWASDAGGRAKVAPSIREIALNITSTVAEVHIENFEFDAQDGVIAGQSSIAAFVNGATKVTMTGVKLVAGKGVDGANGTLTSVIYPSQSALNGHPAVGDVGGLVNLVTCPAGGTTKGGVGGNGGGSATSGGNGTPALAGGAAGALGGACIGPGGGGIGADAAAQPPAVGAAKLGTLSVTGWTGASGVDGSSGTPGQGGGGGTGIDSGPTSVAGGGGGGGAGGCGGAGGKGGKAGGSSIALLVLSSTVALSSSELTASDAGKGGSGVVGQPGQSPGGSPGSFAGDGCAGGKGGLGGAGGAGGGGAGGISVGIAWSGTSTMDPTPTIAMATTITTGAFGAKGIGGVPTSNDGIDGVKQDVLKVP